RVKNQNLHEIPNNKSQMTRKFQTANSNPLDSSVHGVGAWNLEFPCGLYFCDLEFPSRRGYFFAASFFFQSQACSLMEKDLLEPSGNEPGEPVYIILHLQEFLFVPWIVLQDKVRISRIENVIEDDDGNKCVIEPSDD